MSEHHHQRCAKNLRPILNRSCLSVSAYVAGDAHDKDVCESLVEDDFGRDARIGATKHRCQWLLSMRCRRHSPLDINAHVLTYICQIASIARLHFRKDLVRRGG